MLPCPVATGKGSGLGVSRRTLTIVNGKSATKPVCVVAADDDIADTNATDNFFRPLPFNF